VSFFPACGFFNFFCAVDELLHGDTGIALESLD
jgi:hypothetical protein